MNPRVRSLILTWFFLIFPILLGLINLLYGAYSVLGTWDLNAIFIKPDLSNYGYTFSQALFDFDNFIGEFWGNAFSLVYSRIFTNLYIKTFRRSQLKT